jgi:hypothetical protein
MQLCLLWVRNGPTLTGRSDRVALPEMNGRKVPIGDLAANFTTFFTVLS